MTTKIWLVLQIIYRLALARLLLNFMPFKRMAKRLGTEGEQVTVDYPHQLRTLRRLRRWIPRIAGYLPWESLCLSQAYTAACICQNKKIPYTLHLGVTTKTKAFAAHAWLACGNFIVTGGGEILNDHHPVHCFGYHATI